MTFRMTRSLLGTELLICGIGSLAWTILGIGLAANLAGPESETVSGGMGDLVLYWRIGLLVWPLLIAVVLGTSLVASDLESGSVAFAWSIVLSRLRWFAATVANGVLLLLALMLPLCISAHFVGSALSHFNDAQLAPAQLDMSAPLLIGEGLLSLSVVCLTGVVVGRVLPALLVGVAASLAALVIVAWLFLGLRDGLMVPVDQSQAGTMPLGTGVVAPDGRLLGQSEARTVLEGGPEVVQRYRLVAIGLPPSSRAELAAGQLAVELAGGLALLLIAANIADRKVPRS
jgi:hypothetical protein